MLEKFSDEEISGDLLNTGYLYLELPGGKRKCIETVASTVPTRNRFVLRKDGEGPRRYQNLTALFIGEAISFDDIRERWKYHGVLLGASSFCEQLVHDRGCNCSLCVPPGQKEMHPFIAWCRAVVGSDGHVILDTETTGLHGEIIDLAIIDTKGHELYNGLFNPLCAIETKAEQTHHINAAMLENAPTIAEEWARICDIVANRTVITYNAKFDSERIAYSLAQHGVNTCEDCQWEFECAMLQYAEFWSAPPKWEGANAPWQSLSTACYQQ